MYSAGELVYELVSPDGDAFVMQSSSMPPGPGGRVQPGERGGQLLELARRLQLLFPAQGGH